MNAWDVKWDGPWAWPTSDVTCSVREEAVYQLYFPSVWWWASVCVGQGAVFSSAHFMLSIFCCIYAVLTGSQEEGC